uniref:Uncharacterized protein n=1 Tax=Manihot esculenta TaxID=3983 RepID=A0A2C9VA37_MANES
MSRTTLRESRRSSNVLPGSHSQQYHSRGHSLTGFSIQTYENLDLFSISSRNLSVASSDESSNVSMKLGRYDVRSSELSKREVDDSSSSIDKGKHVYDWETDRSTSASTRSSSLARSVPSTEASKLSASEFSADHCTRPSRRSSQFSAYSSDRSWASAGRDINRNGTGTGTPQGFRAASEAQSVGSMGAPECINNTSVLENGNYMSSAAEITSKSIDGRNMSSQLKGQSQPSEMKRKE